MLRPARPSDAGAVAALHAASWKYAYRGIMTDDYLGHRVVADRAALWEELEGNVAAQRFYFAHGAENAGTEVCDAPDDQQLICWRLAWPASRLPVGR